MPLEHDTTPDLALVRFRSSPGGSPQPGVLIHGSVHPIDLAALGLESINDLYARWDEVGDRVRATSSNGIPLADVVLASPVEPRQLLQTGANYRTHVIDLEIAHRRPDDPRSVEQAREEVAAIMDERAAHGEPYFFIGLPQTVVGDDVETVLPGYSDRVDWELELAVIIGAPAFRVSREDAMRHVWGYTIANDLTVRDLVFRRDMPAIGTDWFRGKNAPGFTPTGPFAVPADSAPAPEAFELRLDVNGAVMQDASSSDLLFGLPALLSAASQIVPLLPGDLLLTGSPAGNGQARGIFLKPGDEVVGSITGLGTQHLRFVAEAGR